MNTKQLKTLYKKEIMDVLRDKKTILTMVVLPVILYPLLFLVVMQIMTMIMSRNNRPIMLPMRMCQVRIKRHWKNGSMEKRTGWIM